MKLIRLCKAANSYDVDNCPAIYVADDPSTMVGQGKLLDDETRRGLLNFADDEGAVAIPTETVLRAAGLFLAAHGDPSVSAAVEKFLAAREEVRG
jgi:hypothetical protein